MTFTPARRTVLALALVAATTFLVGWFFMIRMPGSSFGGALDSLSVRQKRIANDLRNDVDGLAIRVGERHSLKDKSLPEAADWIAQSLYGFGYEVTQYPLYLPDGMVHNLEVELPGSRVKSEVVVIGAHYDTVAGSPGANTNASGTAALLQLARAFAHSTPGVTLRFVAFVNAEDPWTNTDLMGSRVYARHSPERGEKIVAMLNLDTIGYYTDAADSQSSPALLGLFYPTRGNFVAFVGNLSSGALLRRVLQTFRESCHFPSEGAALPGVLPGMMGGDQSSFWRAGVDAVLVTDTGPYRYPWYRGDKDTPEKLDYGRMARIVEGLESVIEDLSGAKRTAQ